MKDLHVKLSKWEDEILQDLQTHYDCSKTDIISSLLQIAYNCVLNDKVNDRCRKAFRSTEGKTYEELTEQEYEDSLEYIFNCTFDSLLYHHIDSLN